MRVYIGYDPRDDLAYRACVSSLLKHSSINIDIIPLKEFELRRSGVFTRPYTVSENGQRIDLRDGKPFSTEFSFTRFAVPLIDSGNEWVLFCDADFIFFDDVAKLFALADNDKVLMCVQHDYKPKETVKFDGMKQERYYRKNWSSLMLMRPSKCPMTHETLNYESGSFLHSMAWLDDSLIGELPATWNWLEGWHDADVKPSALHYTRGTPDMLNGVPFVKEWWDAVNNWHPTKQQGVV